MNLRQIAFIQTKKYLIDGIISNYFLTLKLMPTLFNLLGPKTKSTLFK